MTEQLTGKQIFQKFQSYLADSDIDYHIGGVAFSNRKVVGKLIRTDGQAANNVLTEMLKDLRGGGNDDMGWELDSHIPFDGNGLVLEFNISWFWRSEIGQEFVETEELSAMGIPFSSPDEERGTEPIDLAQLFIRKEIDKTDPGETLEYTTYVVWFAYILGGWKALVSTTFADGRYYEVTYNKEADEFYVDTYLKIVNTKYSNSNKEEVAP